MAKNIKTNKANNIDIKKNKSGLVKKILKPLTPLLIAGSLLSASPKNLQAQDSGSFLTFSGGAGLYTPTNNQLTEEVYGAIIPKFNLSAGWENKDYGIAAQGHFSYLTKKGQPTEFTSEDIEMDSESRLNLFQLGATLQYKHFMKGFNTYAGAGPSVIFGNEILKIKAYDPYFNGIVKVKIKGDIKPSIGLNVLSGIEIPFNKKTCFFAEGNYKLYAPTDAKLKELTYTYITPEGTYTESEDITTEIYLSEDINLNGLEFIVGIRGKFDLPKR